MNFISSQKVKTAKVRTMWIGRTSQLNLKNSKKYPILMGGGTHKKIGIFENRLFYRVPHPRNPLETKFGLFF